MSYKIPNVWMEKLTAYHIKLDTLLKIRKLWKDIPTELTNKLDTVIIDTAEEYHKLLEEFDDHFDTVLEECIICGRIKIKNFSVQDKCTRCFNSNFKQLEDNDPFRSFINATNNYLLTVLEYISNT